MRAKHPLRPAFAIFITTVCGGTIPSWQDAHGLPVTYETEREAQLEIVDDLQERLRQFLAGERDFEDATCIEDFVLPVAVWPEGSITVNGRRFGREH